MINNIMKKKLEIAINNMKDNKVKTLEILVKQLAKKDLLLYGAGAFGKEILAILKKYNVAPESFLDINAINKRSINGIEVNEPNSLKYSLEYRKNVTVLLTIVLNKKKKKEIMEFLNNLGYENIIDAQEIRAMYVKCDDFEGENPSYEYLKKNENNIMSVLDLLNDDESKETYCKNIIAHILRDYSEYAECDSEIQYFVKDIPFGKGFSKFVDCGAYIGDTGEELIKSIEKVNTYIAFEPIKDNYTILSENMNRFENKVENILLFPCATSDDNKILNFTNMAGSSTTSKAGDTLVQGIKLDDAIKSFDITFLKMDIEGAEIDALNGAKRVIEKCKPDLAICVYHYINHFWKIPMLINSWNLGYKFYMRAHSSACMETVLYATVK